MGSNVIMLAECGEVDKKTQKTLFIMTKAVTTGTSVLVKNAHMVSQRCKDQALQNQMLCAARQNGIATQTLVICTKVLAPSIDSQCCREQMIEACKLVAAAVEEIMGVQVCSHTHLLSVILP